MVETNRKGNLRQKIKHISTTNPIAAPTTVPIGPKADPISAPTAVKACLLLRISAYSETKDTGKITKQINGLTKRQTNKRTT